MLFNNKTFKIVHEYNIAANEVANKQKNVI